MPLEFAQTVNRANAMRQAGYTYRPNRRDWIRWEGKGGRFHAKPLGKKNGVHVHFDIYVGSNGHHFTFFLEHAYKAEVERIRGIAK